MSIPPGYLDIARELRAQIASEILKPGEAIPSTAELAQRWGVSASVVKSAVRELKSEGLLIGRQGKGVYVAPGAAEGAGESDQLSLVRELLERIEDLEERVRALEEG
ncbi:winged helix-turn-helix domain-containing protein [Actinocorallia libanotica]|uniref:HTH gntR-type domain-containing protein n=1 Tax=Actinocorallia libanotica TaxID=46162 RepID=A0ABN1Q2L7_9ACTN